MSRSRYPHLTDHLGALRLMAWLVPTSLILIGLASASGYVHPYVGGAYSRQEIAIAVLIAGGILIGFWVLAWLTRVVFRAIIEMIQVVVDIEEHTRRTADVLGLQVVPILDRLSRDTAVPEAVKQQRWKESKNKSESERRRLAVQTIQSCIQRGQRDEAIRLLTQFETEFPRAPELVQLKSMMGGK